MVEPASTESDEQVDLDGDNDIEEEMMEDDAEEQAEDDGGQDVDDDEYPKEGEESGGGTALEPASTADGVDGASSSLWEQDNVNDEDDRQKRAELLALPPHGSEIFIGGLHRDATEEDLRVLCESIGEVIEIKLMKDKEMGGHKGYAFITFKTKDVAEKAIEEINNKEFKGKNLRCSLSQVKNRLFIGNIPKNLTEEELTKALEETGPGIENIEFLKDPHNSSRNRGFAFVIYYNHACAEYSRQKMSSTNFRLDGTTPTVSWADPKSTPDPSAAAQVKAIYVKNLPENVTPEQLKEIFGRHGEVTKVVLPPGKGGQAKPGGFGFIHFAERSSALKAVKVTERYEINGHAVEVTLAKPQTDRKYDGTSNSYKSGALPTYSPYSGYGYGGDPYGGFGAGYGGGGYGQTMIYGRGPMPAGMRMVPMVLPDGRLGYVLQQPGAQASAPQPPHRRNDRGGSSSSGGGGNEGSRGRRYRPY